MDLSAFPKDARDKLVARIKELSDVVDGPGPSTLDEHAKGRLRDEMMAALAEYADRLPRVVMGVCPFTGEALRRSFDPYGFDGPWWHKTRTFPIEEPRPPASFKVLLGAVALHGRTPAEATEEVIPGPEVPFVVPRLLSLPGMIAVVSRLDMVTGDVAYPVAYFSDAAVSPRQLHQFWCREEFWFKDDQGKSGWLIATDPWDFDLAPWVASGKLRWLRPGEPERGLVDGSSGEACPYVDLPGDREAQGMEQGQRGLMPPPDGAPSMPFGEGD